MPATGQRFADRPTVTVDEWIGATPPSVWPHVIGLAAMVAASDELQACAWTDEPALGARFTGTNHRPDMGEWTTTCVVTAFDPAVEFGWDVFGDGQAADLGDTPIASWRFTLRPNGAGTRLTQWARMGPGESGVTRVIAAMPDKETRIVARRLAEFEKGMRANLAEIGRRATAG